MVLYFFLRNVLNFDTYDAVLNTFYAIQYLLVYKKKLCLYVLIQNLYIHKKVNLIHHVLFSFHI